MLITTLCVLLIIFPGGRHLLGQESLPSAENLDQPGPFTFPLKNQSLIFTKRKVQLARAKIRKDSSYRLVADEIFNSANQWIDWDEEDLMALIPDPGTPRAFDLNASGCPVHGDSIFKIGGTYPWILDPYRPFKVECPIGHEIYPSNDYEKYVKSGYSMKDGWDTDYVDIGWGWQSPDGERYWFVAYANHWMLREYIQTAVRDLGRAFVLSGKAVYARKAAALLYRISEVYPDLRYQNQSRYGLLQKNNAKKPYKGRLFNYIWETEFIRYAAESYDAVWSRIDQDTILQRTVGLPGNEIRLSIEKNLLEEAFQGYLNDQIIGNFGMHQLALLYLMKARQYVDVDFWLNHILNHTDRTYLKTGLNYALYNFIQQDGIPFESPAYNRLWVEKWTRLAEEMKDFGVNLFDRDKIKSLIYGPLKMSIDHTFTPAIGDSGSVVSGLVKRNPLTYLLAYLNYHDPLLLNAFQNALTNAELHEMGFEMLFLPETTIDKEKNLPQKTERYGNNSISSSELFAGYGVGILRSPNENNAIALTFGEHGSHFHWDFLNFELFAHGQKMMPDLGYPDAMNSYVPGIFAWSKNTVSHNTVVVDAKRQNENKPGNLHQFAEGTFVRTMDASSPAYDHAQVYRRHLVMVDVDSNSSYTVDFFRVRGGTQHHYTVHGPPGDVMIKEKDWGPVLPGTYAGKDVAWGEMYDDQELGRDDYKGGYRSYRGSGFQYLFEVQKQLKQGKPVEYHHILNKDARLRIYLLPDSSQQNYLARAYDKPRARNYQLTYLISHSGATMSPSQSEGSNQDTLSNVFMSVLEPFHKQAYIHSVKELDVSGPAGHPKAILIDRGAEFDIVISDTLQASKSISSYPIKTDATTAVITMNQEKEPKRIFLAGGTFLQVGDQRFSASRFRGRVMEVDYSNKEIIIESKDDRFLDQNAFFNPKMAWFTNQSHQVVHPILSCKKKNNRVTISIADDVLTGRLNVERQKEDNILKNHSILIFEDKMPGMVLLDHQFQMLARVHSFKKNVGEGLLKLDHIQESFHNFGRMKKEDVWVSDVSRGDLVEFKSMLSWEAEPK